MRKRLTSIQLFGRGIDVEPENPRVWLSSGTVLASAFAPAGMPYSEKAMIPSEPWREPSPAEWEVLWRQKAPQDWSTCVGLIRVPDAVLAPLDRLGVGSIISAQDRDALTAHPDYPCALAAVAAFLASLSRSEQSSRAIGLALNPPGLYTATFDGLSKCYIGLHLDSWDRLPLRQRQRARNRICINLGREDRFLFFINLPLQDILRVLDDIDAFDAQSRGWWERRKRLFMKRRPSSTAIDEGIGATALGQAFMAHDPDYPVVKVRIAPREAYIAPTENMIHDGCTLGKRYPDLHLTFLGHFGLPK